MSSSWSVYVVAPLTSYSYGRCSSVCVLKQDRIEVIPNDWGNTATPSYISFTNNGRLFGDAAKYRASINPHDTIFNFKRLLGRRFTDPDVRSHIEQLPYEVVERAGIPFARIRHCGVTKDFVRIEPFLSQMSPALIQRLDSPRDDGDDPLEDERNC